MTVVTKEIIRDLLPVYIAGDASPDTRSLVEEFLAKDEELSALVESARETRLPETPQIDALQSLELKTLDRTRRLLTRKMWLFSFSLFFSLAPMWFVFDSHGIVFLMARNQPFTAAGALLIALAGWVAYLDTCRRLSMTGMQPPQNWRARFFWALTGALFGAAGMLVLMNWTGNVWWLRAIPPVCMFVALQLGERWRQIRPRFRATR
jgi:hypothetical protein